MPALFLYRHYIELALKDLLAAAGAFAIDLADRKFGHDLKSLWEEASKVLDNFGCDKSRLEEAVIELVELDQRADAFRYATDKDNLPHFEKIGAVNMRALIDNLDAVSRVVEELFDRMDEEEAEMDAEIERLVAKDRS
jgi:hypothetical protein